MIHRFQTHPDYFGQVTLERRRRQMMRIGVSAAVLYGLIVAVQCVYGAQQIALPLTRIDDQSFSGKSAAEIAGQLRQSYSDVPLTISAGGKTVASTLVKAGITPDTDRITQRVLDYPLWQRFVPLSLLKQSGKTYPVIAQIDSERLNEFSKAVTPLCTIPPIDATVAVKDQLLVLTPGKNGTSCSSQSLHRQLQGAVLPRRGLYQVAQLSSVPPTVSTAAAQQLLGHAKDIVNRRVQVQLLGRVYTPDAATIADWLSFQPDSVTKQPTVTFAAEPMTAYLTTLQADIYITPGNTIIRTVDGREVGRTIGSSGRGVDLADGMAKLQAQLLAGDGVVRLMTTTLPPTVNYNQVYSRTQAGLQALLTDIAREKGDYAISVRQIGGSGWVASANGGKVYTPASTYKLFVAYALLKRIESGAMHWSDQASGGQTVSACFDAMIINSDNACAQWFGNKIGWKTITDMIHAVGVSSATSLYTPQGFVATADDEALFLAKLQTGQLLSDDSTKRLLDVMKHQIYRSGVPAGAAVPVADKVGFLNGLLHDAAIVYAPSGTYVLVIMSSGSSWGQIADAARQINAQLQ